MATRAVIKIEGITHAQVYKHWDGYPEATLPWLEKFNKTFTEKRGDDAEYRFAQLLRDSVRHAESFALDPSEFTGWGVTPFGADHGQEFEYTLKADGSVEVRPV